MYLDGDVQVLENLFCKQKLLEAGNLNHEDIRLVLLVCGGTLRGVYAGGCLVALERMGLTYAFDAAIGISTGAPELGFFLGGHIEKNLNIYWVECVTPHFISFRRALRGPIADTDYLCEVFRGSTGKGLDQKAIYTSRTGFYVGVTCAHTGEGSFLDAKGVKPDIVEAIRASIALPGLSRGKVEVGGKSYIDGACSLALPIGKVVREFQPTDLLVFANCSNEYRLGRTLTDRFLAQTLLRTYPRSVQKAFVGRNKTAHEDVEAINNQQSCRVLTVWSDDRVSQFEKNPQKLESAALRSQLFFNTHLLAARA